VRTLETGRDPNAARAESGDDAFDAQTLPGSAEDKHGPDVSPAGSDDDA